MRNFYLKSLLTAGVVLTASFGFAQFNMNTNTNIGQKFVLDSLNAVASFTVDFNTAKDSSYWTYDEGTKVYTITVNKCQTQRGLQVNVYPDSLSTSAVINGDFECRDYGGNRNPVRVKSVASLLEILEKFQIKNAGTADSVKNVVWKPSACLFDLNQTGDNQAFGAHPGMYKRVEYGFQYNFSGYSLTENDISFEIDTYDPGNTGKTASYKLIVATGSATGIIGEVANFYVTGSGKKTVKVAAAIGKTPADFSNKKVYIFLKTYGTGTPVEKGKNDPVIIFDNFRVSYKLPSWVVPAAGIKGNAIMDNSTTPVPGPLNKEGLYALNLKTSGRLGTLTITNDRESHATKLFTFLVTGALKAKDDHGAYTIDVPYTFTSGSETVKEKIEVAAPTGGKVNDDLLFFVKATASSATPVSNRLELNCGVRIWFNLFIKGADIIDLTGIDKTTALADTLADVADGTVILLAPGKTYTTGGFAFNKAVEIRNASLGSSSLPVINCAANFNLADASNIGAIVFRNVELRGLYDSHYVFNIDKSGTIREIRFESCKLASLRGVIRMKDNTTGGTLEKLTFSDCVIDSIRDYGLLTVDIEAWKCNDISIENSTIFKTRGFLTSKNNSNKISILNCTISQAPANNQKMFRWRTAGTDNVLNGIFIKNTIFGHGWHESGGTDFRIDGFDGLGATTWKVENSFATADFVYTSADTIPGLKSAGYSKSAVQLWVAPYKGDFNYLDTNFPGFGTAGDPRWKAVQTGIREVQLAGELRIYPNPARDYFKMRFTQQETGDVMMTLYNLSAQKSVVVKKERFIKGTNEIEITTAGLKNGLYIYRLDSPGKSWTGKILISH